MAGHPETPDEYGSRILDAMSTEPERYFARREVAITFDMLAEFRRERLGVCLNRIPVDETSVPEGFRIAHHEELSQPQGADAQ